MSEASPTQTAGKDAVRLAGQGYPIIPLAGGLKEPAPKALRMVTTAQHPTQALLKRRLTPQDVRRVLERYPEVGWGLLLDTVVVLDLDDPGAWQNRHRPFPMTPTMMTADGWQMWFRRPPDLEVRNQRLHKGLEVKGTGLVPIPGNLHPDGQRYLWADGLSIFDLPPAPLPEWALALIRAKQPRRRAPPDPGPPMQQGTSIEVPSFTRTEGQRAGLAQRRPGLASVLRADLLAKRLLGSAGKAWPRVGPSFACILPGHDERKPSASLWRSPSGELVYRDFHQRHGRGAYRLVDVYVALQTGEVRVLGAGEQVPWSVRMLSELGLYTLPPLEITPAPGGDVPPSVQKLWQAIVLLLKCRLGYEIVDPGVDGTPLTGRFLGRWANMDDVTAWRGLEVLVGRGYLRRLPRKKGRVTLYLTTGHIRHRSALAVGAGPWARDRWGIHLLT